MTHRELVQIQVGTSGAVIGALFLVHVLKPGAFPEPGELIGLIVDVKISPEQEKSLLSYTYRLLGSRLSVSPASDEFQVQPLCVPQHSARFRSGILPMPGSMAQKGMQGGTGAGY